MVYTIDEISAIIEPIAVKFNLQAVYLFGSYASGTANDDSDIDLLIDTTGSGLNSLMSLGLLYEELSERFKKKIDLMTFEALEEKSSLLSKASLKSKLDESKYLIYEAA